MKWLYAESRNIFHGFNEKGLTDAVIEAVIVLREPKLMTHDFEQVRFAMSIESAEAFAKSILKWVADAKAESNHIVVKVDQ